MAGLQVTSPSSCASAHAARAAASLPHGASTKALRKASPPASLANAPLSRARWIHAVVSSLHCRVVEQIGCGDGDQLEAAEGDVGVHVGREEGPDGATHRREPGGVPAREPLPCSPGAAGWGPSPVGLPVAAGSAPSVRSRPGEGRSRPIRRRRRTPGPRAGCPLRRGGRAASVVLPRRPERRQPRPHGRRWRGSCRAAARPARPTADSSGPGWPRPARHRLDRRSPRARGPGPRRASARLAPAPRASAAPRTPAGSPSRRSHHGSGPGPLPPPARPRLLRRAWRRRRQGARRGEPRRARDRRRPPARGGPGAAGLRWPRGRPPT